MLTGAVRKLFDAAAARGWRPRITDEGKGFKCLCPTCQTGDGRTDHEPALHVSPGEGNAPLVFCHGACGKCGDALLAELGLTWPDVLDGDRTNGHKRAARSTNASAQRIEPREVERWTYVDESGAALFDVVRFEPGDHGKSKTFRQYLPGKTSGGIGDARRVLYRLPDVLAAVRDGWTIYVVEGEKCADAVNGCADAGRIFATNSPMGAKNFRDEYADSLSGAARVEVWRDRDEDGRRYAHDWAAALTKRGIPHRIIESPHAHDAADHLAAGHELGDVRELEMESTGAVTADGPGIGEQVESAIPPLPESCFREGFDAYRRALATSTEASDNYHFGVYLAVAGLVAGRRAYVSYGRQIFPCFYMTLIGPTGKPRKSTAISRGFDGLRAVTGDDVQVLSTCSWEGLLDALKGDYKRVLLNPAEFRLLAAKASEKATASLVPGLTLLYDSPASERHKTRGSDAEARWPFLSILTASTAEWFRESFEESHVSGGFLNRWLFVDGTPKAPNPFPDEPVPEAWEAALQSLRSMDQRLRFFPAGSGRRFDLTGEAREIWRAFYHEALEWKYHSELLSRMGERLPELTLKVALTFALLDGRDDIGLEQLEAAIAFCRWEREAHVRVFEGFGETRQGRVERLLMSRLESYHAKRCKPTKRDLQRALGSKATAEEFNRALRAYTDAGRVTVDKETTCVEVVR